MTPPIGLDDRTVGYFEYIKIQTSPVIPSERSESRNLGADLTADLNEMRRFLDALRLLEMTYCFLFSKPINHSFSLAGRRGGASRSESQINDCRWQSHRY
jgi:hypothetical protein